MEGADAATSLLFALLPELVPWSDAHLKPLSLQFLNFLQSLHKGAQVSDAACKMSDRGLISQTEVFARARYLLVKDVKSVLLKV